MRFLTMWYVRQAKSQTSLRLRADCWYVRPAKSQTSLHLRSDCSEPLQVARIFYEYYATD